MAPFTNKCHVVELFSHDIQESDIQERRPGKNSLHLSQPLLKYERQALFLGFHLLVGFIIGSVLVFIVLLSWVEKQQTAVRELS